MSGVAAVILAGGRGERLGGVVKARLAVGGVRLLDRVASRLADCSPILVAHGPIPVSEMGLNDGMMGIADPPTGYGGPLVGVAAAVAALCNSDTAPEFLLSAAVDTPFLPDDFLGRLRESIGSAAVATAAYGGQAYPTNALWRLAALAGLPAELAAGRAPRSLMRLAAGLGGVTVEWPGSPLGDPFANLNTPADREALERRAAALR